MASSTQCIWTWDTPGDGKGQRSLVCCSPWSYKELDIIYRLKNNIKWGYVLINWQKHYDKRLKLTYSFISPKSIISIFVNLVFVVTLLTKITMNNENQLHVFIYLMMTTKAVSRVVSQVRHPYIHRPPHFSFCFAFLLAQVIPLKQHI